MKKLRHYFTFLVITAVLSAPQIAMAQADMTVFRGNQRSQAGNPLDDNDFRRVGAFKVKGNSFVLKGANSSDIYTNIGFGPNMPLLFDANTQEVSILQEDRSKIVNLSMDELDSFIVKTDNDGRFPSPVKFINASRFEPSKKMYLQQLTSGPLYGLYKSYKVELRQAASDLAQTNVREFEIIWEYFYIDMQTKTEFVKINNVKKLKRIFKDKTAALEVLKDEEAKTEALYISFFKKLNDI